MPTFNWSVFIKLFNDDKQWGGRFVHGVVFMLVDELLIEAWLVSLWNQQHYHQHSRSVVAEVSIEN